MRACTLALLSLSLLLLAATAPQSGASAQAAVQVSEVQSEYRFGNNLHLRARIQSPEAPQELWVFYRSRGQDKTQSLQAALQGDLLDVEIDLYERTLVAFSEVEFWFALTLSSGQFVSEKYTFFYADNRYDWNEPLSDGPFSVYWYEASLDFGQRVLDASMAGFRRLDALLELPEPEPIRIYVYASSAELQATLSMGGLSMVAGHANPALGLMLISIPNSPDGWLELERQAPHELAHLLLYQKYGPGYTNIPAWLNEGLASNMETRPNSDYQVVLEEALRGSGVFSFGSLCRGFPAEVNSFYLSYAQSEWFVRYLRQNYGDTRLRQLLALYADGMDCERAPQQVYGQDLDGLQRRWLGDLQRELALPADQPNPALTALLPWLIALGLLLLPLAFGLSRLAPARPVKPAARGR